MTTKQAAPATPLSGIRAIRDGLQAVGASTGKRKNAYFDYARRIEAENTRLLAEREQLVAALRYITEPDSGYHGYGINAAISLLRKLGAE